MYHEEQLDKINVGDTILFRGHAATVKRVWRTVAESPIKLAACGVEIDWVDKNGTPQSTRLSFPELRPADDG